MRKKTVQALHERLSKIEERFDELGFTMKAVATTTVKRRRSFMAQNQTLFGLHTAFCIDTLDPWLMGRVRFWSPLLNAADIDVKSCDWAYQVSTFGGFDASGSFWVPPAGSKLCLIFDQGHRSGPFYIGTTWDRYRGPEGNHNWGFPIAEFERIHSGHRKGYLIGPNDESTNLPPWNTENYNTKDPDDTTTLFGDVNNDKKLTYSNIYGFVTPQKHGLKLVDGNYRCNHRAKRIDLQSSCGNWMMMKDDHIHYCGQWAHTSCGAEGEEADCIDSPSGDQDPVLTPTKEMLECSGDKSNDSILIGHPSTGEPSSSSDNRPETKYPKMNSGSNPFFKHANECRPFKGPQTPANNKCALPQSGIQLMSISGHTIVFDDSVEEPRGIPNWERSMDAFDFGCNNKFAGRTYWKSTTGHVIEMSDVEEQTGLRGENNYIKMATASGNKIELNDHTTFGEEASGDSLSCPPNIAGEKRGIRMRTTSNHTFEMIDHENEQCSPFRKDGGQPTNKAKKAFIRLKTGYGLVIEMEDVANQQETERQKITIMAPQKDNIDGQGKRRGPHYLRMTEAKSGPGKVEIRAGGNLFTHTFDNMVTMVGDKEQNPSNKIVEVSKNFRIKVHKQYFNAAKEHIFKADKRVLLMAGKDCPPPEPTEEELQENPNIVNESLQFCEPRPCVYPVLLQRCGIPCPIFRHITHYTEKAASERVFASGKHPCDVCPEQANPADCQRLADAKARDCSQVSGV